MVKRITGIALVFIMIFSSILFVESDAKTRIRSSRPAITRSYKSHSKLRKSSSYKRSKNYNKYEDNKYRKYGLFGMRRFMFFPGFRFAGSFVILMIVLILIAIIWIKFRP